METQVNLGYCLKCKSKKEIKGGKVLTNKKGNRYIQGNCDCGARINRILKKETKLEPVGDKN
jgi:hypothetical protein